MSNNIQSALIFGAKDHIGRVVAQYLHRKAPQVALRVATHRKENLPALQKLFPYAEAVVADLLEERSLTQALGGMEGIFQISPDVFNEDLLVDTLFAACTQAGSAKHIVRILGMPPGADFSLVPPELKKLRYYPAMQHLVAKQRYIESGLPVTFVNVAGYYMDDFLRMFSAPIFAERTIRIAFDKRMAWIDPVDVAEVSAELLLSDPSASVGRVLDVTGVDLCTFSEVAALFSRVIGTEIRYDGDEERFYRAIQPVFSELWGPQAPDYFMKYFKWETAHQHLFRLTHHVRDILQREPTSFERWAQVHKEEFLDAWRERENLQLQTGF